MKYDANGYKIKTYKVVDVHDGGVLNHIQAADNEADNDTIETRERKRREQAEKTAQRWMQTYFADRVIKVQEVK